MLLDFRDVNTDIQQFQSQGSVSKINAIVKDAYDMVRGALSVQSSSMDRYNKISQILIQDGQVRDITPDNLKATASSLILQESINAQSRLDRVRGTIATLSTDQITTPLSFEDITSSGTIISYDMGILITPDHNYINPVEFVKCIVGYSRNEVFDLTHAARWIIPGRFTPLIRYYASPKKVICARTFADRQLILLADTYWEQSGGQWVSDYYSELHFTSGGSSWDDPTWSIPIKTKNIRVQIHIDNALLFSVRVFNGLVDITSQNSFFELVTNDSFNLVAHPLDDTYRLRCDFFDNNVAVPDLRVGPAHSTIANVISAALGVDRLSQLPAHLNEAARF